jgi:hypothetical protein
MTVLEVNTLATSGQPSPGPVIHGKSVSILFIPEF